MAKIQRALISVSDKDGLLPFAKTLAEAGVEILSTGGTARVMREAGLAVPIAEDDCVDSEIARAMRLPLPIDERRRVAAALSEGSTGTTA